MYISFYDVYSTILHYDNILHYFICIFNLNDNLYIFLSYESAIIIKSFNIYLLYISNYKYI